MSAIPRCLLPTFRHAQPLARYISEKVVRALAVGAVPVMWSRVAGWERIVPGPLAAVFVEDFGFDALKLVRALEAEAQDEQMYMLVCARCGRIATHFERLSPSFPPFVVFGLGSGMSGGHMYDQEYQIIVLKLVCEAVI